MRAAIASALIGVAVLVAGLFRSASLAVAAEPIKGTTASSTEVRNLIPPFDPRLDAVRAPAGFGTGRIWRVGPNEQYRKPSDVVARVHDGDIVEIEAARYACDTSVKWRANYLTLVGVGGRPVIDATGCHIAGDKGSWNPLGKGLIVANIEFMGAAGPSNNDAGIRYDGTGYLYITKSYFHDNQDGILATPPDGKATDIVISNCDFAHNGMGDGYSHNIYISYSNAVPANSFVIRFSYSHGTHRGNQIKTRALSNYILYNRIADEDQGDSNHAIDIPQGGLTYIIGNVIQHGAHAATSAMVSYSAEPIHNPIQEVYLANNTIVSELPGDIALRLIDNGLTAAKMVNNLVIGVTLSNLVAPPPAKITVTNNVVTSAPHFRDVTSRNYHLTAASPAVNAGIDGGIARGFPLAPAFEFEPPAAGVLRPTSGKLDAGAYEYSSP